MSDKPKKLTGIWRGYVSGTNRAAIFVRFVQRECELKAQAVVFDHQFGPSIIQMSGNVTGQKAQLRLLRFLGNAPLMPLDGQITVTLDEKFTIAEGNWSTDIGTTGICKLLKSNESDLRWYYRLRRIRLGWFIMRWRNTVYCAALLCVAVAALTQRVQIPWQVLILLLLPAPFLFSHHLARLAGVLQFARVKKIGPIEFQTPPTPEILAAANPQGQEGVTINQLNQFFALRTKVLLAVLAHSNEMPVSDFSQLARSFGVPDENLEITMKAIIQMGCAQLTDNKIIPTAWGQRYVRFGLRLA
jgi:hypothetical protein